MNKVIIIGAGASGLFCSILLKKLNYDIRVIEKNPKAGRKILASGNGKCNITNQNLSFNNFNSTNNNFFKYAISNLTYEKIKDYFSSIGLEMVNGDNTRMYPMSMQASSVRDILFNEAISLGVKFIFDENIINTKKKENLFYINSEKNTYTSEYLIIANGSSAMEKLGSSSSGYKFAKSFGHNIIKPFASLVQLKSNDQSILSLSGVKIKSNIKLYINDKLKQEQFGDILFTKYGVSGNAILDLSRMASKELNNNHKVTIMVDFIYNIKKELLFKMLKSRVDKLKSKEINYLLESVINSKLIKYIYLKANIGVKYIWQLNKKDIENIVYILKNTKISIISTNGKNNAEVCAGGVNVNEIDDKTMQSKIVDNLYFIGEVLDVDGNCGGYNFHWAWSSAYVLSKSFKKI